MKKGFKYLFLVIVGIMLGALLAVGIYFLTVGEVAWKQYLDESLIPNIVLALSSISALLVGLTPVLKAVKNALSKFDKATSDINETVDKGKNTQELIEEQQKRIDGFIGRFDKIEEMLQENAKQIKNVQSIEKVAFSNMSELVRKGCAVEINKVGENEEEPKA